MKKQKPTQYPQTRKGKIHDQHFKELIQSFFKETMEFLIPNHVHKIDFTCIEFLNQEFFHDKSPHKSGKKLLDVVAKVKFLNPDNSIQQECAFILIHMEFQQQKQPDFAQRMFHYFCALTLKHGLPVYPIVLFTDKEKWRLPIASVYELELFGLKVLRYEYHLLKLSQLNWRNFLKSENPVVTALMTHMGYDLKERPLVKAAIIRILFKGKMEEHPDSLVLQNFIECYLRLNKQEDVIFRRAVGNQLPKYEAIDMHLAPKYKKMAHRILQEERALGKQEGKLEGKQEGKLEEKLEIARQMLAKNCKWDFITEITGVTKDQLEGRK
jgi:hypothetical protein